MSDKVKYLTHPGTGRVFYVTDTHGRLSVLEHLLKVSGFDESKDLLISGGDWVDRGPESHRVLEFLSRPYVHSVRGNHEEFCISSGIEGASNLHLVNGGEWFNEISEGLRAKIVEEFSRLPFMIELRMPDGKRYGFVHAEVIQNDWEKTIERLVNERDAVFSEVEPNLTWARTKIEYNDNTVTKHIDMVFVGHSVVRHPYPLGNTLYMDTGAGYDKGKLTLLCLDTMTCYESDPVGEYY